MEDEAGNRAARQKPVPWGHTGPRTLGPCLPLWTAGGCVWQRGTRAESAGTYLKVDGPVPISIEGAEQEVRIGGGVWGKQGRRLGCVGADGQQSPQPRQPHLSIHLCPGLGFPLPPSTPGFQKASGDREGRGGGEGPLPVKGRPPSAELPWGCGGQRWVGGALASDSPP